MISQISFTNTTESLQSYAKPSICVYLGLIIFVTVAVESLLKCPWSSHGPLTRYVKLQVAHAPGMPGTFSPAADFKWNRWLAIPACITARAWRTCRDACRDRSPAVTGKTFPAFSAHAHPQFCVSGKRPIPLRTTTITHTKQAQLTRRKTWPCICTISSNIHIL